MYREKTQTRFVESGYIDIDNKMLVANAVPESAKKVNKIRTNDCKLNSAEFSRFDLRDVVRVYSHDSLSRFWSNHSGNKVN